jgi:hypothetical protein
VEPKKEVSLLSRRESQYGQILSEQQATIDMLITMLREALDEIDGYCVKLERFADIIEQTEEKDTLERFK